MADSAVAITAGSGTNIDTRTEGTNSNHRQVIVIGDPATNAGVAPVDATAGLKVDLGTDNDVVVTNAGTFVTQENGAALTALQLIDNPVVVDDAAFTPATTSVMMAGFEYDDTTPDGVNEGDAGAARMSANRNQYVQIRDNAGNERGLNVDASGNINVTTVTTVTTVAAVTAISNALPAGTNAIGKLAANSGVDIGDVDVTTVGTITPGTAATSLGKAVDVAAGASDVGVLALAVRDDALAALTPIDGDYTQLRVDSTGAQWIRPTAPATGTQSSVSDNAASVTILASNASRRGASVYNDSSAALYLLVGAGTASTTAYTVKIASGGYYEVPSGYTGILVGIWASDPNDGAARVTEWT